NNQDTSKILTGKGMRMSDLAVALADEVHREVINKTSLDGHADITLKWSDDVAAEAGGPNVISIFTAVEEQLGLKLQSSKGPVDTLVIDHAEMPSEN
ncbi:MAG TPA: TIGR03435 family protein, partial [Acidobacteriaceae bacterium]